MLRTSKQVKKICTACPIAKTADLVGDSYVLLIVRDLLNGNKRFTDLEESLHGTSSRTLTLKLKLLIEKGIIEKVEYPQIKPLKVEYSLTKKGRGLSIMVKEMQGYGEKYL